MAIDRDKTLQAAQALVEKRKYDKAIVEYRKLVAKDPSDVRTLLKIGDLHLKLDQHEGAISTYEEVGDFYFREGFAVKAIAVYKQIRGIIARHCPHLEPKYGHILPRLAEIYTQLGLTSDALAAYDEVANQLRQEGRERDALDVFKKVVELDPENPIAKLRVADSRVRLGDIDKAAEAFAEAAEIMRRLGRHDDALKVYERLLEHNPAPEYARLCAETYLERGGPSDGMNALSKIQIAFKADPKDVDTLEVLVRAFDAISQPRKALEVLKEAARTAKDAGDEERFGLILEELKARAPNDPFVYQLTAPPQPEPDRDDLASIRIEEPTFIDPGESIDEVLELTDVEFDTLGNEGDLPSEPMLLESYDADSGAVDAALRGSMSGAVGVAPVPSFVAAAPPRSPYESLSKGIVARTIEESELLTDLGRFAEARAMIRAQLQNLPDNPLLLGALRQIEAMAGPETGAPQEGFVEEPPHSWANLDPATYGLYSTGSFPRVPDSNSNANRVSTSPSGPAAAAAPIGHDAAGVDRQSAVPREITSTASGKYAAIPTTAVSEPGAKSAPAPESGPSAPRNSAVEAYVPYGPSSNATPAPSPVAAYPATPAPSPVAAYPASPAPSPAAYPAPPPPAAYPVAPTPVNDIRAQYDLGMAYLGVGKYNEAIASLNYAARDPQYECTCRSMIGNIYLRLGDFDSALAMLHQALASSIRTREQDLAIGYEIANTYEHRGMLDQAAHFFEWLIQVDASYVEPRGAVTERLRRLRDRSDVPGPAAPYGS